MFVDEENRNAGTLLLHLFIRKAFGKYYLGATLSSVNTFLNLIRKQQNTRAQMRVYI